MAFKHTMTSTSHYPTSSRCTKSTKILIHNDASSPKAIIKRTTQPSNEKYGIIQRNEWFLLELVVVIIVKYGVHGIGIDINYIHSHIYWYLMVNIIIIWTIFNILIGIYGKIKIDNTWKLFIIHHMHVMNRHISRIYNCIGYESCKKKY
eukprot:369652_1